jgi:hypothetical protein
VAGLFSVAARLAETQVMQRVMQTACAGRCAMIGTNREQLLASSGAYDDSLNDGAQAPVVEKGLSMRLPQAAERASH